MVRNLNSAYKRTLCASYIGYITQAIVINLSPLLFVMFQKEFEISLSKIGLLVTYNFCAQILVDLLSAKYVERIGYKVCIVAAHICSAAGLVGLGLFPSLFADPYIGLLLATTLFAVGGGLIEVLISPIVEALPLDNKSGAMSMLHSFYCWGYALVVILTTVYFYYFGTSNWRLLTCIWALIPIANAVLFAVSPILQFSAGEETVPASKLFTVKIFWLFALLMVCAGAAEHAMCQWASYFAEQGLGISKTLGDLMGPCMFALLSGTARLIYALFSNKIPLKAVLLASGALCVLSYLIAAFSPLPMLALVGCGLTGLAVGLLWPGVLSMSASKYPKGGTAMFALLALAGDVGCAAGPSTVGFVSEMAGGKLQFGLLAAVVFPVLLFIGVSLLSRKK